MSIALVNQVNINYHTAYHPSSKFLEIKLSWRPKDELGRPDITEVLGEFLLTKEAALELADRIYRQYNINPTNNN